ncbi:MAG: LysR family transcriptional regulator [Pseudomonadota bacterium]
MRNEANWNRLYYFCEIAREKSLKIAAENLGITPSTLSEHLSQLEESLQVALFLRRHRKLILTPQGANLYQHIRPLFEAGQRLMDVVSPLPLGCYPIAVGIVPGTTRVVGSPLLLQYVKRFGPFNLNFSQTTQDGLERGLLETEFDFGICHRAPERRDVTACRISSSPVRLFVTKKMAGRSARELFKTLPILSWKEDSGSGGSLDKFLGEADLHSVARVTGEDMITLHQFCEAGLGIGVFSEAFVKGLGSRLVPLRIKGESTIRMEEAYVAWFKEAEKTAAIQHLRQLLKNLGMLRRPFSHGVEIEEAVA